MSGIDSYGSYRIAVEDGFRDKARTGSLKGQLPRGHLVENDAEREQIRATIQCLGPYLLGRHVGHGSQSYPRAGEMFFGDIRERLRRLRRDLACTISPDRCFSPGQSRESWWPPLGNENVGGFDVTMNDAFAVRCIQRIGNLDCNRDNRAPYPACLRRSGISASRHPGTPWR